MLVSNVHMSTPQALPADERASFRLDPSALTIVQSKAIESLYVESGQTIVELIRTHPAVAIPVVLARMEQKDAEW